MKIGSINPIYILVLLLSALTSCLNVKPLQFEKVDNIQINKTNSMPQISFDLVGYNPNKKRFKVKDLQTTVMLDGQSIADVHFDKIIRLTGEADFSFTASVSMPQENLTNLMSAGLSMLLNGGKMPLQVKGDFILKKSVFRKRISFQLDKNIDPQLLKGFF